MGQNDHIKDGGIVIKHFWADSGLCYLLEPTFSLNENDSPWFALQIKPNQDYYDSVDHDLDIQLLFASTNTWQGIFILSWQFLNVPKLLIS